MSINTLKIFRHEKTHTTYCALNVSTNTFCMTSHKSQCRQNTKQHHLPKMDWKHEKRANIIAEADGSNVKHTAHRTLTYNGIHTLQIH